MSDALWVPLPIYPPAASLDHVIRRSELSRLLAYWQSKVQNDRLPARRDIDPVDVKYVLGNVVLVEVHRAPLRFRYRLHGIDLVQRDGFDMTGKWLSDHPEPEYRDRIAAAWTVVIESGGIMHGFRNYMLDNRIRTYEVLVLPLADDGAEIDKLFVVQMY